MATRVIRLNKDFFKKFVLVFLLSIFLLYFLRIGYITLSIKFQTNKIEPVTILDRNGQVIYNQDKIGEGYLDYRKLDQINPFIIRGVIAAEDKNFRTNIGIDFPRLIKCTYSTFILKQTCGASTITQQYIKLETETHKRTITNKVDEIFLSFFLNMTMSKDEILERYLNKAYFGNLRYGINSASKGYFNKENIELNLAESAFLLSIPNSPNQMDPYTKFENTKERQELILKSMLENQFISEQDYELAVESTINLGNYSGRIEAPHFVSYVTQQTDEKKIETTMDLTLYRESLRIIRDKLSLLEKYNATNASVVILDAKTGDILTMIGSVDYFSKEIEGQVNSAIAERNPGSTVKPFVYGYAFSKNLTPATLIHDKEQIIRTFDGKNYFPRNYDRHEHGWVSAREAIGNSFNIPAVVVLSYVSNEDRLRGFYDFLDSVGLEEAEEQGSDLASALGGFSVSLLDLSNAYRVFANDGKYVGNPLAIKNQIDNDFDSYEVFENNSAEIAHIISDILDDEESRRRIFGSMGTYNLPFNASVKSGTTTDFYDSWTIGYTENFVIGVWVGNNDHTKMYGVTGTAGAGEIWKELMLVTNKYYEQNQMFNQVTDDKKELNLEFMDICSASGELYTEQCEGFSYQEIFIRGKNPTNPQMVKKIYIIDSELLEIVTPINNDSYLYQDGLRIEIQFHPNREFDEYILFVDDSEVDRKNTHTNFFANLSTIGKHKIQIQGLSGGKIVSSTPIFINVENYED
jgi:penicillin-binding protein 1C